jgi:hypothetical protein
MSRALLLTDIENIITSFKSSNDLISYMFHSIDDSVQYISVNIVIKFDEGSSIHVKVFPNFIENVLKTTYIYNKNTKQNAMTEKDIYIIALDLNKLIEQPIHDFYLRTQQLV